jgi:hypothetical protein
MYKSYLPKTSCVIYAKNRYVLVTPVMPASHWSATFQPIILISIFIVVLIAIYAGQIKKARASYALDLNEKIDTSSNEGTLHRRFYFYIGSEYVSAQNSVVSSGQMYVEHLVPIKVIQPFPIVFIPGNGIVTIDHWFFLNVRTLLFVI